MKIVDPFISAVWTIYKASLDSEKCQSPQWRVSVAHRLPLYQMQTGRTFDDAAYLARFELECSILKLPLHLSTAKEASAR